jgi:hypothetical protein
MNNDAPAEDALRSASDIARRAIALSQVISVAFGAPRLDALAWLEREGLANELSPKERVFLASDAPSREDVMAFTWRVECLAPLLWSIGKIGAMPALEAECDTYQLKTAIVWPPAATELFIQSAMMRTEEEIEAEYEKVYDAHWHVRDARLFGRPAPAGLNEEVIFERHYGFNWLIGYGGQDWDEVSTDT